MEKLWLGIVAIIVVIAIALIYVLIPSNIIVSKIVYSDIKSTSVVRCLHNDSAWQQWFPGRKINKNTFSYSNQVYQPGLKTYTSNDVLISGNNKSYSSEINIIPISFDSSAIEWKFQFTASKNPFKRVEQYQTAKKIKANITALLNSFKTFIERKKNIYGFNIWYTTLTDTALVAIRTIVDQYPSTEFIYSLVNKLKQYIKEEHATEHNYPMLNITQQGDRNYEVMVAIPTNIFLKGNDVIKPRRMIMLKNKTLVTEVTGDTSVIRKAFNATSDFMTDYELSSPVIPFQQLVTNRSNVRDSTKWITHIFTPII